MKAAPEGVAMDGIPEPLATKDREYLHSACVDLHLSENVFELIEHQTKLLRDFETHGKRGLKSPRGKVKALEDVAAAAKVLAAAIRELDIRQLWDIGHGLPPDGLSTYRAVEGYIPGAFIQMGLPAPDCKIQYPWLAGRGGRVGHIGFEAENLSRYCSQICKSETMAGVKGGRKKTLDQYAFYIENIWCHVNGSNIKLTRGGNFERLCEAVFIAAGVRVGAEGAVRRYIENKLVSDNAPDDEPF